MKLTDANIVVYANGVEHEYKRPCQEVLRRISEGHLNVCINVEVVQEVVNLYHRRGRTEKAARLGLELMALFPVAFDVTTETMNVAIRILTENPHLQSRGAVHAATVFQHNLEGIISTDKGFDRVVGLKRFDPKELAA